MPPNTEMATASQANPQMPMFEVHPASRVLDKSMDVKSTVKPNPSSDEIIQSTPSKGNSPKNGYARMPSWKEFSPEPQFKVGILIDNTSIRDRHVVAISRPASSCTLASLVILHPFSANSNEPNQDCNSDEAEAKLTVTATEWLRTNKAENVVDSIDLGQGQEGWEKMIQSSEIDAVYIVVPPWYVSLIAHRRRVVSMRLWSLDD
jgi:hypothetical protein